MYDFCSKSLKAWQRNLIYRMIPAEYSACLWEMRYPYKLSFGFSPWVIRGCHCEWTTNYSGICFTGDCKYTLKHTHCVSLDCWRNCSTHKLRILNKKASWLNWNSNQRPWGDSAYKVLQRVPLMYLINAYLLMLISLAFMCFSTGDFSFCSFSLLPPLVTF